MCWCKNINCFDNLHIAEVRQQISSQNMVWERLINGVVLRWVVWVTCDRLGKLAAIFVTEIVARRF